MERISTSRTTPAIIVAVLALVAALMGTAVAADPGASTSALSKKKVKKIAKKQAIKQINAVAPGLADEQITRRAPGLSVAHAASADNAAQANVAANATTVNDQRVTKVFAKIPPGTSDRTIATVNAFAIRADCTAGGDVDLVVDPVPPAVDATLQAEGNGDAGPIFQTNGGGELNQINLDTDGLNNNDRGMSTFSTVRSGGFNLTGLIGYEDSPTAFGENVCIVHGKLISG